MPIGPRVLNSRVLALNYKAAARNNPARSKQHESVPASALALQPHILTLEYAGF